MTSVATDGVCVCVSVYACDSQYDLFLSRLENIKKPKFTWFISRIRLNIYRLWVMYECRKQAQAAWQCEVMFMLRFSWTAYQVALFLYTFPHFISCFLFFVFIISSFWRGYNFFRIVWNFVRLSVNSIAISLYTELSYLSVINVDNTDNYINYSVCVRGWGCVCVRLGVR